MKCSGVAFLSVVFAVAGAGAALAQATNAQAPSKPAANAQFDISGGYFHAFNKSSTGSGTIQTPANADGGMVEARYLKSDLLGFGMSYSFSLGNTGFVPNPSTCSTFYDCYSAPTKLTSKDSELGLEWVPSIRRGRFRPFAIGGLGFYISVASGGTIYLNNTYQPDLYQINTVVRAAYIFGGGSDIFLTDRLGIRAQYRYNMYKAPNLAATYSATGVFTSSSEPMMGVFYVF